MIIKKFKQNGFSYINNKDIAYYLRQIRKIVLKNFPKNSEHYSKLSLKNFNKLKKKTLLEIQKNIKLRPLKKKIVQNLKKYLKIDDVFLTTSYLAFHTSRPLNRNIDTQTEFIAFHRENFYCDYEYINHQINVWLPIFDLDKKANLQYIPNSHKISDNKIKVKKQNNFKIKKNSDAHFLGGVYAPKKIIKGVNLSEAKSFNVPKNNYLIFSSRLIHGNGVNFSKNIRYTIAMGFIPKKKFFGKKVVDIKSRSNLPHYISI